ncbi:hypothetical protein ACNKHO_13570 [Shigella flexneri]
MSKTRLFIPLMQVTRCARPHKLLGGHRHLLDFLYDRHRFGLHIEDSIANTPGPSAP